jgi:hypothetical protein
VLLGGIGRPIRTLVVEPNTPTPLLNDVLVVSFGPNLARYLSEARTRGFRNVGLLHMGDELGDHDRGFYANADYVLRNYWFKEAMVPPSADSLGVLWIPNGYSNGVGPITPDTLLPASERKVMGFFSGTLASAKLSDERRRMAQIVQDAKLPFQVGGTAGFGKGLPPLIYAAYLCMTRFGLVPGGVSPETIRLYEVLEAGAIPVMRRSPFVAAPDALDNPPFVLLDDWAELPAAYAPYADALAPAIIEEVEARRRAAYDWWTRFKAALQARVKDLIDRSFARAHGP